jgi:hypothetical protein
LFEQQHVTPHIGFTVPLLNANASRLHGTNCKAAQRYGECARLDAPNYDWGLETKLVVERTNALVGDKTRMATIDFFDDKGKVVSALRNSMLAAGVPARDLLIWVAASGVVTHDSTVVVWREKVLFDRIRPTTVIQSFGEDVTIESGAWPEDAVIEMLAKDWQPYKRVMPHSEFPSGSQCVCLSLVEMTRAFLLTLDPPVEDIAVTAPIGPRPNRHDGAVLQYPNLASFLDACGQSRLDGGMHFTPSIAAATELCQGIGEEVWQHAKQAYF